MIQNASPQDRQRVLRAIQEGPGDNPAVQQHALEALRERFGGQLSAGSEETCPPHSTATACCT